MRDPTICQADTTGAAPTAPDRTGCSRVPRSDLPERRLFPTEADRSAASADLEHGLAARSFAGRLQLGLFVAVVFLGPLLLLRLGVGATTIDLPYGRAIAFVLTTAAYVTCVIVLSRGDVPRDLRRHLVRCGVPVCIECGRDLRGLSSHSRSCPDCGAGLSTAVRRLLGTATGVEDAAAPRSESDTGRQPPST